MPLIAVFSKKQRKKPNSLNVRVFSSVGRASPLQGGGRGFEPLNTHQVSREVLGAVVQLVRISACHAEGRGFESRPLRHIRHSCQPPLNS